MEFESNANITVIDSEEELYFLDDTVELREGDIYFTAEVGQFGNGRIDQFANHYLGDARFADVLAEFNEMEDMTNIEQGDLIFIPFDGSWTYKKGGDSSTSEIRDTINKKISAKLPNRKRTQSFIKEGGRLTF